MKKLISLIVMCCIATYVTAYTEEEATISDIDYLIYNIATNETPLVLNHSVTTIEFAPYNITTEVFNNNTNVTENISSEILFKELYISCGPYIDCSSFENITSNTQINMTINFDADDEGQYESHIIIEDANDTELYVLGIRFYLTLDSSAYEYQSYEFKATQNYYNYYWYDGQLPRAKTNQHSIKTQPNERLYLNCTGFIQCSQTNITTTDLTTFSATLSVPEGTALGTYTNYIYATTSYNKSGVITYEIEIDHTPIEIVTKLIAADKPIENMSAEELRELFVSFQEVAERKILELEASNKTTEKIVEKKVEVPFLANEDQIVNKVLIELNKKENSQIKNLLNVTEEMLLKYNLLLDEKELLTETVKNLSIDKTDSEIVHDYELRKQNESIHKTSFVLSKEAVFSYGFWALILSISIISYIIIDRKSMGF